MEGGRDKAKKILPRLPKEPKEPREPRKKPRRHRGHREREPGAEKQVVATLLRMTAQGSQQSTPAGLVFFHVPVP